MIATSRHAELDAEAGVRPQPVAPRAEFEKFYELWMPRVYRFAARRLRTRAEAEAATRATLEAAVRAGFAIGDAALAARLIELARVEIAQRQGLLA